MAIQFPSRSFSAELRKSSKNMELNDAQLDRILQSVLTQIETPHNITYTKAAQAVDRLASAHVTRIVNSVIATGTGAAVMAAALFLVVSINTNPQPDPSVTISDSDIPLANPAMPAQNDYMVTPAENPIDALPVLDSFWVDDSFIYLSFHNIQDDQMWHSIYGIDAENNRIDPVEILPAQGTVKFPLPVSRMKIYLEGAGADSAPLQIPTGPETE